MIPNFLNTIISYLNRNNLTECRLGRHRYTIKYFIFALQSKIIRACSKYFDPVKQQEKVMHLYNTWQF